MNFQEYGCFWTSNAHRFTRKNMIFKMIIIPIRFHQNVENFYSHKISDYGLVCWMIMKSIKALGNLQEYGCFSPSKKWNLS